MKQYDVIIVGLGPTGGTLANLLALNGFSILILEREKNLYALPRAVHFDDEIMRVFQTIGITKNFLKSNVLSRKFTKSSLLFIFNVIFIQSSVYFLYKLRSCFNKYSVAC